VASQPSFTALLQPFAEQGQQEKTCYPARVCFIAHDTGLQAGVHTAPISAQPEVSCKQQLTSSAAINASLPLSATRDPSGRSSCHKLMSVQKKCLQGTGPAGQSHSTERVTTCDCLAKQTPVSPPDSTTHCCMICQEIGLSSCQDRDNTPPGATLLRGALSSLYLPLTTILQDNTKQCSSSGPATVAEPLTGGCAPQAAQQQAG
jgi:hypothetical protein